MPVPIAVIRPKNSSGPDLVARIQAWQAGASLVHYAGCEQALWLTNQSGAGAAGGRTSVMRGAGVRQDGKLKRVLVNVNTTGGAAWAIRQFRYNYGTSLFDFVQGVAFTPGATGVYTLNLSPAWDVQNCDTIGFLLPNATSKINMTNPRVYKQAGYAAGDITSSNAFASLWSYEPEIECLGNPPYLALTGDSIFAGGSNGATVFYPPLFNQSVVVPNGGGDRTAEVGYVLRGLIGDGATLQYQNLARGSQTFAWVRSTGMPACVATGARYIAVLCGINDITTGRAWADVLADINAIIGLLAAGQTMILCEILPRTANTDIQAATVRTWNSNFANIAAANPSKVVLCQAHDAMGQVRAATGHIDDLKTTYNVGDGTHLTYPAGVTALAGIIKTYL